MSRSAVLYMGHREGARRRLKSAIGQGTQRTAMMPTTGRHQDQVPLHAACRWKNPECGPSRSRGSPSFKMPIDKTRERKIRLVERAGAAHMPRPAMACPPKHESPDKFSNEVRVQTTDH